MITLEGELGKITVRLDVVRGFVLIPVPFYVQDVVADKKQLDSLVQGVLEIDVYVTLLDLERIETFAENTNPKYLIVQLCELGKRPVYYNWHLIRRSKGSKPLDLIWAAII